MIPCPTDEDRARALLVPIPAAIIMHELCVGAMAVVPPVVQRAFDQLRPVYFPEAQAT